MVTSSSIGDFQVTYNAVDDVPTITPLEITTLEDNVTTFTLQDLIDQVDNLFDDDTITIYDVAGVDLGTLEATPAILPSGELSYNSTSEIFTFTPFDHFTGPVSIPFTSEDGTSQVPSSIDLTYTTER